MTVTAAQGFLASGVAAGIKESGEAEFADAAPAVCLDLDVAINDVRGCRDGAAGPSRDKPNMSQRRITVTVGLRAGEDPAVVRTDDLTAEYVHENSTYSS
ncbi:bifunctional ornithine acetyltransferase/N-acetylglutamate synthase [Streptomyces xantholiticus]|uniref:bifunctional ornithine acetyltransferase/N-acetylglutamate synthase n=1 Tax=Streptomyces xantholiticus TaxID=68285 RepID=UPI001673B5F2|nr:bifunctional ornithine acetyltransferase/N-acetylglutamate synthase [Streptomyces xantholiticus]GGW71715.1 hypothetical protein GCM10010381_65460 [Streptomyces xantholiticus]